MNIQDFDWNFYIENNLDLKENNINTKESAIEHWLSFGQNENRINKFNDIIYNKKNLKSSQSSSKLDELYLCIDKYKYLEENNFINKEDAWNLLLMAYNKSHNNMIEICDKPETIVEDTIVEDTLIEDSTICTEDKKYINITIENFDWVFYINNNLDLINNGINNKILSWEHWINLGKNENRDFRLLSDKIEECPSDSTIVIMNEDNFDWEFYIKNNTDLIKKNIIEKDNAWYHLLNIGIYEDRTIRILNNKIDIIEDLLDFNIVCENECNENPVLSFYKEMSKENPEMLFYESLPEESVNNLEDLSIEKIKIDKEFLIELSDKK